MANKDYQSAKLEVGQTVYT